MENRELHNKDTMKDLPGRVGVGGGGEGSERKTLCAGIPHNNFTDNEYIGKMRQHTYTHTPAHTA